MRLRQLSVGIYLFLELHSQLALASMPLSNGFYQIIGRIQACRGHAERVCVETDIGGAAQRIFEMEPSEWDVSLRSAFNMKLVLRGTLKDGHFFRLKSDPKLFRDSTSEIATPSLAVRKID